MRIQRWSKTNPKPIWPPTNRMGCDTKRGRTYTKADLQMHTENIHEKPVQRQVFAYVYTIDPI